MHPPHVEVRQNPSTLRRHLDLVCGGMDAEHTPHERPTERRYTVNEAAEILGISAEAVRARINRGTLPKEKGEDGTVYVRMNAAHTHTNGRTNGERTTDHTVPDSPAFQLIQDQVDYLRQQLEVWQEEARRKDHIIAALVERVPELEPASAPRESPDMDSEGSVGEEPSEPASTRSWWRRFFGL